MKPSFPDELLAHDAEHALVLSNLSPRVWWLDLRHLPTGETRILVFTAKAKAKALFKNMTLAEIVATYDKIDPPTHKMYKPITEAALLKLYAPQEAA